MPHNINSECADRFKITCQEADICKKLGSHNTEVRRTGVDELKHLLQNRKGNPSVT